MHAAVIDTFRNVRMVSTDARGNPFDTLRQLSEQVAPSSIEHHQVEFEVDADFLDALKAQEQPEDHPERRNFLTTMGDQLKRVAFEGIAINMKVEF